MDLLFGAIIGTVIGVPFVIAALWQPPSHPPGYRWVSVPDCADPGTAQEVGTPNLPNGGVPTSSTDHARSVS